MLFLTLGSLIITVISALLLHDLCKILLQVLHIKYYISIRRFFYTLFNKQGVVFNFTRYYGKRPLVTYHY